MIQKTKKYPHSPSQVKEFSKNHKNHSVTIKTSGGGKSSIFLGKMNSSEIIKLCEFIESNFVIHKEDF